LSGGKVKTQGYIHQQGLNVIEIRYDGAYAQGH
jgi:hypothetical protein